MKILVSWIAYTHDFVKTDTGHQVNLDGPTVNFHRYFYKHDRHFILSGSSEVDARTETLMTSLRQEFKERATHFESVYMGISDPIDINLIRIKVEEFLLKNHREDEIDIFFSPGTSAMQIAWYLIHTSLALQTRLFQVRAAKFSKDNNYKTPELLEITTDKSLAPYSAIIREETVGQINKDYLISSSIEPVYFRADKIAQTDATTTLINGASGTGKEHLARYIHEKSVRSTQKFIAINCSAFTDQLLESRLFGHIGGSFTDAKDHRGLFEEANNGTIFLDEIGDISPYMQQVLLRVLQEKKIMRIGENKEIKINVRVIAATNKNLPELCRLEKFRWDLYYRLAVAELSLPSLFERTNEERNDLIEFFLESKKKLFRRQKRLKLEKNTLKALLSYQFPGNVRELENLIEQLYVFNETEVQTTDLPERITKETTEKSYNWKFVEKALIFDVLEMTGGNKAKAIRILGYGSINTLKSKMSEYQLND